MDKSHYDHLPQPIPEAAINPETGDFFDVNNLPPNTPVVSTHPDGRQFKGDYVIVHKASSAETGDTANTWYIVCHQSKQVEVSSLTFEEARSFLVRAKHVFPPDSHFPKTQELLSARDEKELFD